jgi:hypothetical protein
VDGWGTAAYRCRYLQPSVTPVGCDMRSNISATRTRVCRHSDGVPAAANTPSVTYKFCHSCVWRKILQGDKKAPPSKPRDHLHNRQGHHANKSH